MLAGGAVAVAGVVVVVGVVASVVEVELVDDESPLLASGLGSAEVDVVAEPAALAVVFTASAEPVSGPAMPAARAESTARRIRLRAEITPAIPTLRSSRADLLRPWAGRRRPELRRSAEVPPLGGPPLGGAPFGGPPPPAAGPRSLRHLLSALLNAALLVLMPLVSNTGPLPEVFGAGRFDTVFTHAGREFRKRLA